MTDKERIEVYVNRIPKKCKDCPFSDIGYAYDDEVRFCKLQERCMNWISLYTDKYKNCPLKTIQSVQNQRVVEALEKVKQSIADITAEIIYQDCRWLGKQAVYDKIDQFIKEYGG